MKLNNKKKKLVAVTLIIAVLVASIVSFFLNRNNENDSQSLDQDQVQISQAPTVSEPKVVSLDLAAVGDMLPHETVTQSAKTSNGYNYLSLISPQLQESFKKADLRFCNQEAPSAPKLGVRGYPSFNAPAVFPKDLNGFGCNLISTGNNHSADAGSAGISGTLEEWEKIKPLAFSGTYRTKQESNKLNIIEKNGIKIGFSAFNEFNNQPSAGYPGVAMLSNEELLGQQIKDLKLNSDVVVVSVHWGAEDSHQPTQNQKMYAQKISELGADIIIGTGPHVWQPYEVLQSSSGNKTHVWYSIGNALNTQTKADQLFSGVALLKLSKNPNGQVEVSNPRVLPTYMHYVWTNGIGLSESQLLGRKELKWTTLTSSSDLISKRNDFKTTPEKELTKLKDFVNNESVKFLESY
jgi:poly-gamma-glutamate synthesis protein (capsule biosynthesis protein)